QLLVLLQQRPLTRVDARLAALAQAGLAPLQELPLPGRDRLLRRLPTPSSLGHAHLATDDGKDEPAFVFNRENRRTCHVQLPSRGPRRTYLHSTCEDLVCASIQQPAGR